MMTVRSRAAAPVQLPLHAPRERACPRRARPDDFGLVRNQVSNQAKIVRRAGGDAKTLHHLVLLVLLEPPMGIPRAAVSPCLVLHSIDWEGEQALLELTLVDALHCDRVRTDQAGQRQGAMGASCKRGHQLAGEVR